MSSKPNQFAKLFERDGQQALVTKDSTEEGLPSVKFTFEISDTYVSPAVSFKDTDKGYEERDRMFDDCDEDTAFGMRAKMIEQFGDALAGIAEPDEGESSRKPKGP